MTRIRLALLLVTGIVLVYGVKEVWVGLTHDTSIIAGLEALAIAVVLLVVYRMISRFHP